MKKICLAALLSSLALGAFAAELQTANDASVTARTRTEFDLSVDDPSRFGLTTSIPELSLNFSLTPWQRIGDKPHSSLPVGFLQFELDKLEIRYTNGAVKDYNAPSGSSNFGFKFNDSATGTTGYFGPAYLPNMRSGIVWGDWTLQLASAGTLNFWNPWNRDFDHSYQQLAADWAYLDTRVQYRRGTVAAYLANPTDESGYWSYDHPSTNIDDLYTDDSAGSGALIGLEYDSKLISGRFKFNTRYPLVNLPAGQTNGLGFGGDIAFTPVKGLTSTTSVAARVNYVGIASPEQVGASTKLSYDAPLPGFKGASLAPMLGYDYRLGLSGVTTSSQEGSAALTFHWPGTEGWAHDMLQDRTGTVYAGATVAYKLAQLDMSASALTQTVLVTLYEDQGDAGLIKGLGSEIVYERDMGATTTTDQVSAYFDWTFKLSGGAGVIPWTRVLWDSTPLALSVGAGVKLDKVIPKTQIGATYQSRELISGTAGARLGTVSLYADVSL